MIQKGVARRATASSPSGGAEGNINTTGCRIAGDHVLIRNIFLPALTMRLGQQVLDVRATRVYANARVRAQTALFRDEGILELCSQFAWYEIVTIVDIILRPGAPLRECHRLGPGANLNTLELAVKHVENTASNSSPRRGGRP